MRHQNARKKLNLKPAHKRAMLRNQVLFLIDYGHIVSTKARIKELRKFAEKLVTITREGNNFNVRRRINALLPYKQDIALIIYTDLGTSLLKRLRHVMLIGQEAILALYLWVNEQVILLN
jgi:large subunit ribosomal protein L17